MEAVHAKYPPPSTHFARGVSIALVVVSLLMVVFTVVLIIVAFTYCNSTSPQMYSEVCR